MSSPFAQQGFNPYRNPPNMLHQHIFSLDNSPLLPPFQSLFCFISLTSFGSPGEGGDYPKYHLLTSAHQLKSPKTAKNTHTAINSLIFESQINTWAWCLLTCNMLSFIMTSSSFISKFRARDSEWELYR